MGDEQTGGDTPNIRGRPALWQSFLYYPSYMYWHIVDMIS